MKVYTVPAICAICGVEGLARPQDAVQEWLGADMVCTDRAECLANLRWQREREKQQGEKEGR